jgi:hypothetical protein
MVVDGHEAISTLGPAYDLRIHSVVEVDHVWTELLPERFQICGSSLTIGEPFRNMYGTGSIRGTIRFAHCQGNLAAFLLEQVDNG